MENRPRISIIVPYYNTPVRFLAPLLKSILSQDYEDFELLVVNDGSTDKEGLDLLSSIPDQRLKVINKENGGVSSARNLGLTMFSGDLLYFADSDDELRPGLFSFIAKNFEEDETLDLLVFSTDLRLENGKVVTHQHHECITFTGEEGFAAVCTAGSFMYNNLWGKVYNVSRLGRDKLVPFNTSITRGEDKFWHLMMMREVKKGKTSGFIGYIHNVNPGSITHHSHTEVGRMQAFELMLDYIDQVEGKSGNYYEMMASYYNKTQWSLMLRVFSRKDSDKKAFKETLSRLHKELKGKRIKSSEYAWRKLLTPLLLIIT